MRCENRLPIGAHTRAVDDPHSHIERISPGQSVRFNAENLSFCRRRTMRSSRETALFLGRKVHEDESRATEVNIRTVAATTRPIPVTSVTRRLENQVLLLVTSTNTQVCIIRSSLGVVAVSAVSVRPFSVLATSKCFE